ncbi:MAG: hypothetical protein KJ950_16590 [Proteobacteria bacterium]|nr:hypothetical protein [Pseudomonadota bacterium]MBU1686213.1 hypothetical protein [Pseudomonadota bacterium]
MSLEIIEKLLEGFPLSVILETDDQNMTINEPYYENIALPHIVTRDGRFWACSFDTVYALSQEGIDRFSFYFCSSPEIYGVVSTSSFDQGRVMLRAGTIKRFTSFSFQTFGHQATLLYDHRCQHELGRVERAIQQAASLFVVFLDEEGFWNIHPVVLPQKYLGRNEFFLQTSGIIYPMMFRSERYLSECLSIADRLLKNESLWRLGFQEMQMPAHVAFYWLRSDGTYQAIYDQNKTPQPVRRYSELRVYAVSGFLDGAME